MLARAPDQGFCEIAAIGAALRRSQRISDNSSAITSTHGTRAGGGLTR